MGFADFMVSRLEAKMLAVAVSSVAGLGGCGGGDEGGDGRAASSQSNAAEELSRAVAATEDAGTAAFELRFTSSGGPDIRFSATGTADFDADRERYLIVIDALPDVPPGTKADFFVDSGNDYLRPAGDERFRQIPKNEEAPVANGVTDSLSALSTDTTDVRRDGSGEVNGVACKRYRGKFDAEKIAARADPGREEEAKRDAAALDGAPVSVCVDERDRLREFKVGFAVPSEDGYRLNAEATLDDFGEAEPIPPLEEVQRTPPPSDG